MTKALEGHCYCYVETNGAWWAKGMVENARQTIFTEYFKANQGERVAYTPNIYPDNNIAPEYWIINNAVKII